MFPDFRLLYELGVIPEEGMTDEAYRRWYEQWTGGKASSLVGPTVSIDTRIWLAARLPAKDFSERIDVVHISKDSSMFVPKVGFGQFWAVATTPASLQQIVGQKYLVSSGAPGEPPRGEKYPVSSEHMYITYKVRIKTEEQWLSLLEFLAKNGMLEPEP